MGRSKYEYIVTLKDGSVIKVNEWEEVAWCENPSRIRFIQAHGEHTTIMTDVILMVTKRRMHNEKA